MASWNAKKTVIPREEMPEEHRLKPSLSWPHLIALGVGAIVGTGILTLTGVGAAKAGPAVILSFAIAGLICIAAALAYAEMATMIPASGSAYTYTYVVLGEGLAWIVGWSLILEYSLVVSAVAVGWSGYTTGFLADTACAIPPCFAAGPELGGIAQPAGHLHHLRGGRAAHSRHARERDGERPARRGQGGRTDRLRRRHFALFQPGEFRALHALRLSQIGSARGRGRGDGGRRDHLLRLLRLRRDRDRGGGDQESRPRPQDRNHRIDGGLRHHLHDGGGRGDRRAPFHALRRQPRAAGPDPAYARPGRRRQSISPSRRWSRCRP